jgi:CspA family cold shock protein
MLANCPLVAYAVAVARGTVKFFKPNKGWGAIASPALPEGMDAWVHFSVIEADGFRALEAGDDVDFEYESATQDSFRFRATRVRKL